MTPELIHADDVGEVIRLITQVLSNPFDIAPCRQTGLEGAVALAGASGAMLVSLQAPLRSGNCRVLCQHGLEWPQQRAVLSQLLGEPIRPMLSGETDQSCACLSSLDPKARPARVIRLWGAHGLGDAIVVIRRASAQRHVAMVVTRKLEAALFDHREVGLMKLFFRHTWLILTGNLHVMARTEAVSRPIPDRLREVLLQLQAGHTPAEIGQMLHISRHTVYDHIKKLHRLLGVSSRTQLLAVTRNSQMVSQ